tara:strand:- start:550 stop:843 length:294 start_codon:yes stop_codon:yes gene_type:complete
MSEQVKFSKEEMDEISNIQKTYLDIQQALGQISVNKIKFQKRFESLEKAEQDVLNSFSDTEKMEADFLKKIQEKYGEGNLDLTTGKFTPRETENKSK